MTRYLTAIAAAITLAGCQTMPNGTTLATPQMSPVGTGMAVAVVPVAPAYAAPEKRTFGSLWGSSTSQPLFTDLRANGVGDTVTVNIAINDKAQFDNQTDRSRSSKRKTGIGAALGVSGFGIAGTAGEVGADFNVDALSQSKGEGSIGRAEKLRLSIAAIVTQVLPGGNLMIAGSQEIMVNEEIRVLNIAGIVRPVDISADNTIAYDKIAEARISYGGRGHVSDVQRPAWGQRVLDGVAPF